MQWHRQEYVSRLSEPNLLLSGLSPAGRESDSLVRADVSRDREDSFISDDFDTVELSGFNLTSGADTGAGSGE